MKKHRISLIQRCGPQIALIWILWTIEFWALSKRESCKTKISKIEELKQRIKQVWDEMDQREIDKAISEWRPRLQACIRASGGDF